MRKTQAPISATSIILCSLVIGTVVIQQKPAYACLVEPCPAWPTQISTNFGNTFSYDSATGVCIVEDRNGRVIQKLTTCRKSWYQIAYTENKLLFYDRSAGEIEVYNINNQGLANRLQRFTHAQHRVRKTWAQITSPRSGIISFRDDNGQVENYRLENSGMLVRL